MAFAPAAAFRRIIGPPLRQLAWALVTAAIRCRFPKLPTIRCEQLAAELAGDGDGPVLVDAREAEEFGVSHLAGARHLPTVEAIAAAGLERQQAIVVYCSVGYRSARLAEALRRAGYRDVRNLEGSLFHWANLGLPLESDLAGEPRVHPCHLCWGLLLEAPGPPRAGW